MRDEVLAGPESSYDRSVGETLNTKLDQINLRCGVDLSIVQPMPEFPEELSRP